jgi:hypothetical protein
MPQQPISVLTRRFTLKQVMRLLKTLTNRSPTRTAIKYYGLKVQGFKPLVKPQKVKPGKGRGQGDYLCTYSVTDVVLLRWFFDLREKGLSVRKFYKAIDYLYDRIPEALEDPDLSFFLTDNEDLCMSFRKGESIQLTGRPGQILLSLDSGSIQEVVEELRSA